ncbi:MAG: hypothetical protein WBG94_20420 [Anaerolineales bacterium]
MKKNKITISVAVIIIIIGIAFSNQINVIGAASVGVPKSPVPESEDFATLTLRDPWDMSEFSDISQYLNESGQRDIVRNPNVSNGVFSGTSAGDISQGNNGNFFPLFPGYETAMLIGKVGHRYPIDAQLYHCLYVAMQVNTPPDGITPDRYRVFYFADDRLNTAGNEFYGSTYPIRLFDPGFAPPQGENIWQLQKVDLSKPPEGFAPGKATWNDKPNWQGLRIDPTSNANTDFSVDWVRLTKCQPNFQTITWSPDSSLTSLWLKPVGTSRYIRVATDVVGQSGSYQLDVQGIAPGRYYVGLSKLLSDCCTVQSNEIMEINQSPIVEFASPNFYSGPDYATLAGNPWDFQDPADTVKVRGTKSSYVNGVLDLVTPSTSSDPKIYLNTPELIPDSREYRYLNFHLYTEGPWQNTPDGMILRWIWVQLNNQGDECYRVSQDIPLNVGWHIYSIDLSHPFNGIAEEVAVSCNGLSWHWLDSSPLSKFRFDPNENILGIPLHQQLDWVRLTKVEQVLQGSSFTIRVGLNKLPSQIGSTQFFYTNDRSSPTQHPAQEKLTISSLPIPRENQSSGGISPLTDLQRTALLPVAVKNFIPSDLPGVAHELIFNWDTSAVIPGEYFICARVDDNYNEAVYCSEAPVEVIAK